MSTWGQASELAIRSARAGQCAIWSALACQRFGKRRLVAHSKSVTRFACKEAFPRQHSN